MAPKVKKRRPLVAALLSLVHVGLSHIYAGQPRRGLLLMAIGLAGSWGFILDLLPADQLLWQRGGIWMLGFCVALALAFLLAVAVDAYRAARQAGAMALRPFQRWYLYLALVFVLILSQTIFDALHPRPSSAYNIPSGTMVPTVLVGDYVQGARYLDREPQRGDIATYFVPEAQVTYVKRIVGLPGDRVQMMGGRLYLNGELVPREPVEGIALPDVPGIQVYRETLPGGASYLIAEMSDSGQLDDTEPVTVPPGQYFALGDNRDNSRDSRVTGPVPREQMQARLFYLFWSHDLGRIGLKLE